MIGYMSKNISELRLPSNHYISIWFNIAVRCSHNGNFGKKVQETMCCEMHENLHFRVLPAGKKCYVTYDKLRSFIPILEIWKTDSGPVMKSAQS